MSQHTPTPMEIWLSGMICAALHANSAHITKAVPTLASNPKMGGAMEPTNVTHVETRYGEFRVTVEAVDREAEATP